MNLEKQVCSLELSKRLEELGVKQESLFYWLNIEFHYILQFKGDTFQHELDDGLCISAFTVAELGEMLFAFNIVTFKYKKGKKYIYEIAVQDMEMRIYKKYQPSYKAETEADARAKMLIYLIENGLLTMEKCDEKIV